MPSKTQLVPALANKNLLKTGIIIAGAAGLVVVAAILLTTNALTSASPSGYVGPGGIGNSSENNLWIDFSRLSLSDANDISTVTDFSGNNNTATSSSTARPNFRDNANDRVNGRAIANFDGVNDMLKIASSTSINSYSGSKVGRTLTVAFCTGTDITTQQFLYEEGGTARGLNIYLKSGNIYYGAYNKANDDGSATTPWGYVSVNTAVATNTCYLATLTFDIDNDRVVGYLNGTAIGTVTGVGKQFAHGDAIGLGGINAGSYDASGAISSSTTSRFFKGKMMEFISYSSKLNDAQRLILDHYLAAKYGVNIANDQYAYQGSYSHEVAGIWMASDGTSHVDAKGTAILRINGPSALSTNEGIIWGHNGASLSGTNSSDVDTDEGIESRLDRTWMFSVNGTPGTVNLTFDVTAFPVTDPTTLRLIVDRNGDNFQTIEVAPITGTYSSGSGTMTFSNVSIQSGDNITLGSVSSFLPVEMTGFEATPIGEKVELTRTTATELNNNRFDIERSTDGKMFSAIGEQKGAGNSQQNLNYRFVDQQPIRGTAYYRLKQVDFGGAFSYTEIKSVTMEGSANLALTVFPNPVRQGESLQIRIAGASEGSALIRVMTIDGRAIQQSNQSMTQGQDTFEFPTDRLSPGTYIFHVMLNNQQMTQKVILQ